MFRKNPGDDPQHSSLAAPEKAAVLLPRALKSALILAAALAVIILLQAAARLEAFDDAYITFRYARNISQGLGFVYNPGERVLGTTTPLYTLLLAAVARISNPDVIPQASRWIAVAADALNVLLIYRLAAWLFQDSRIAACCALVYLLHPLRLNVAAGGMETSLFLAALLTMYDSYLIRDRKPLAAAAGACAVLIRPDALLAVLPLFAVWLIQDRKGAFWATAIFILLLLPWAVWSTWYFGSPLPHSITAKSITYKNPLGHAAYYLLTFLGTGTIGPYLSPLPALAGLVLTILVVGVGLRAISQHRPRFLAAALYPPLYCLAMTIVNPAMYFSWYFPPLLPGMLLIFFSAIWFLPVRRLQLRYLLSALLSLTLLLVPAILHQTHPGWPLSRSRESAFREACGRIVQQVDGETTILAPDIGVLGWCLEKASILDPIGLVSPRALAYSADLPPDQLISPAMIENEKPDYIISLDQFLYPAIRRNAFFTGSYQLIYSQEVTIIDQSQPLYIFEYLPDS